MMPPTDRGRFADYELFEVSAAAPPNAARDATHGSSERNKKRLIPPPQTAWLQDRLSPASPFLSHSLSI